jgi:hypothetical protein
VAAELKDTAHQLVDSGAWSGVEAISAANRSDRSRPNAG